MSPTFYDKDYGVTPLLWLLIQREQKSISTFVYFSRHFVWQHIHIFYISIRSYDNSLWYDRLSKVVRFALFHNFRFWKKGFHQILRLQCIMLCNKLVMSNVFVSTQYQYLKTLNITVKLKVFRDLKCLMSRYESAAVPSHARLSFGILRKIVLKEYLTVVKYWIVKTSYRGGICKVNY